jgi:hypothetical protein
VRWCLISPSTRFMSYVFTHNSSFWRRHVACATIGGKGPDDALLGRILLQFGVRAGNRSCRRLRQPGGG